MKALVKKKAEPGIWMEDVPVPKIEDHEVLIKTLKTSICGTDVHIYKWDSWAQKTVPVPLVIGHEYVGIVHAIGKNVKGFKVGDRVCGEGHITCGTCPLCMKGQRVLCPNTLGVGVQRHGCFAEYFNVPAENLFKIPDSIPDDVAAIFDPYGNAVHTALSTNLTGEDVLITGAGPIGIMASAIARKAGARTVMISDPNENRLKLAQKMGATHLVNLRETSVKEEMKKAGLEYGFTVGMEMSGHPDALKTLLETAQNGGHISLLGILPTECTIDWDLVIFKMLRIKGIYGREIFETWFKMTSLIESGLDLNPIITHKFHVDQFEEAFQTMIGGHSGKVILDWT